MGIKVVFNPVGFGFSDRREDFKPGDREERKKKFSDTLLPLELSLERIDAVKKRYPDCVSPAKVSTSVLEQKGLEKFGCLAMNTAICLKPDGSVAMPCIEFPRNAVKSNDLFSVFHGEAAGQARKKQGKYWFCEQCQLTCMISSTSLVKFLPLFYAAQEYLPQLFKTRMGDDR